MTRAAVFLSAQFTRLHLRPAPPTPLLPSWIPLYQHRKLPSSVVITLAAVAVARAHTTRTTSTPSGSADAQRISSPSQPKSNSQTLIRTSLHKEARLLTSRNPPTQRHHSSASSWIVLSIAGLLSGIVLYTLSPSHVKRSTTEENLTRLARIKTQPSMATEIQPGRPETLTKEEETKLRELWIAIFKVCGVSIGDLGKETDTSSIKTETKPKRKVSLFRRYTGGGGEDDEAAAAEEDKYGLNKVYSDALKIMTPQEIRESIWGMVKIDNPDALLLRFLRARKWDVQKALVMMISTMKWRTKDMLVDEDIMLNGELVNLDETKPITPARKKLADDFMGQLTMGKSFSHGLDKEGRPICIIRVRLHKPGAQSVESLERFTVYQIETTRLMMIHPTDTANICFDMTDFGLANLDYVPIKFIIKCFEANYPESLGVVLLHKAPWIFQGIWKIIRGWLDPVVAAKVHFTNTRAEFEEYVDLNRMIPEMEGEENWEYNYVEPVAGESDAIKDTVTRDKIQAERNKIVEEYEKATIRWIKSTGEEAVAANAARTKLANDLQTSYWQLDPYVRARSIYDRWGVINPGGKINFYPGETETAKAAETAEAPANGTAAAPVVVQEKTEKTEAPAAVEAPNATPIQVTA